MGLAKASPTMTSPLTRSRSTVSSSSTGSNCREVRVTTRPPSLRHSSEVNPPVPCISGQAGIRVIPAPPRRSSARTSSGPPSSG